jgi:hypothetical protein
MMSFIKDYSFLILFFLIIGVSYKNSEKRLKSVEQVRKVNATFSPSLEYPQTTCFSLDGSKRSFFNPKKYNETTVFEVVEAEIDGKTCVRKVLANGKDLLLPKGIESCVNYEIPDTICVGGEHCTPVREHCY